MPSLKALDTVIPTGTRKLLANQTRHKLHYLIKKKQKKSRKKRKSQHTVSKWQMCVLGLSGIGESHGQGCDSFLNDQGWVAPRRLFGFTMQVAVWPWHLPQASQKSGLAVWECWAGVEEPPRSPLCTFEAALSHWQQVQWVGEGVCRGLCHSPWQEGDQG